MIVHCCFFPSMKRSLEHRNLLDLWGQSWLSSVCTLYGEKKGGHMAERLGNLAINQKVAGLIPGREKWCLWTRHFTLLASGGIPCTYCKSRKQCFLYIKKINIKVNKPVIGYKTDFLCSCPAVSPFNICSLVSGAAALQSTKASSPDHTMRFQHCDGTECTETSL